MSQFIKFYFTSYVLNMFRALIQPSSGACDYSIELPRWSYCSWFDVCLSFGEVDLEWYPCCRLKHNLMMSLAILFHFLFAQHVSDTNISIIRSLRLFCWVTTLAVFFLVRCVLEFRCVWVGMVSVLQTEAQLCLFGCVGVSVWLGWSGICVAGWSTTWWCHLLFCFTSYVLNMFRTLIYPSSGACDYSVQLPHWSCSSWFDVCWSFGVVGLEWYPCCRLKPATRIPLQPNHTETPTQSSQEEHDQCGNSTE